MVAQHGTLNFLHSEVYMVLSLPATAFNAADEDNDGKLSLAEFSQHRIEIVSEVAAQVTLSDSTGILPLHGLMISPVTPHDAPKEPADQIIVMGRFSLNEPVVKETVKLKVKKLPDENLSTSSKHIVEVTTDSLDSNALQFHVGLFGKQRSDQSLEITAHRKSESQQQVFTLTPEAKSVRLNFR